MRACRARLIPDSVGGLRVGLADDAEASRTPGEDNGVPIVVSPRVRRQVSLPIA